MSQTFAFQLGIKAQKINVGAQNIIDTTLEIYGMIVSTFFISDKDSKMRFFEKNLLLANVKLDIVLEMLFITMSNTNNNFKPWDI